jgi:hypothetical protein
MSGIVFQDLTGSIDLVHSRVDPALDFGSQTRFPIVAVISEVARRKLARHLA